PGHYHSGCSIRGLKEVSGKRVPVLSREDLEIVRVPRSVVFRQRANEQAVVIIDLEDETVEVLDEAGEVLF
ncbi:MAG: hypothetical protein ACJ8C7_00785, partial [Microvirga sp.]